MLGPVLFGLVACAVAQRGQRYPDAPKVTVAPADLKRFGITEDVNQPGQFQRLVSITPGINSTNPQVKRLAEKARDDVQGIYANIQSMSAIHITTGIIEAYKPLPEGPLAQFVAAHVLNLYVRLHDILNKINDDAIEDLSKFVGAKDSSHQIALCTSAPVVSVLASHFTREIGNKDACAVFAQMTDKDDTTVKSIITEAAKCKGALNQVNQLLGQENVPLNRVFDFLRSNPVIPTLYHSHFYQQILSGFNDYSDFYNAIENSQQIANVFGMPLPQVKSILVAEFTNFLKTVELF